MISGIFYLFPFFIILGIIVFFARSDRPYPTEAPIHTNWATHNQYKEIGLWLRDNIDASTSVRLSGEIGTLAFYSQRRLLEVFSYRHADQFILDAVEKRGPIIRLLGRINFLWYKKGVSCTSHYYLNGYMYPVKDEAIEGNIVKKWRTSTKWITDGRIVLVRR